MICARYANAERLENEAMKSCRENPVCLWDNRVWTHIASPKESNCSIAQSSLRHTKCWKRWRAAPAAENRFLQGLIQVAVALHHHSKENRVGARSLLARARRNLSGYPDEFGGIFLKPLLKSLAEWQEALEDGKP